MTSDEPLGRRASTSVWAAASGVGSWPGTAARPSAQIVAAELALAHLVELPARGVGADMIGRGAALLVDIAVDISPSAYRLTSRPGSVMRRARGFLAEDIDALEEAWERDGYRGSGRVVKVQAPGPVTLAAQLELSNGHRAITDLGAVRDLTTSLAEGLAQHRDVLARRLDAAVVVQLDEPLLPAALEGRLSGASIFSPVHPVDTATATSLLDECVDAAGGVVSVHMCVAHPPWELLTGTEVGALGIDAQILDDAAELDGLAAFLDRGKSVVLGLVPSIAAAKPPSVEVLATRAAALADKVGFGRAILRDRVGVSTPCGLAGATSEWARIATELTRKVSDLLAADPDAL